jgi:hypothetical protein
MNRLPLLFLSLLLISSRSIGLERPESKQPAQNYLLFCAGCHGLDARGVTHKVPALTTTLPLFMRSEAGRDFVLRVPGVTNSALSDHGLAEVLNWLMAKLNTHSTDWQPFNANDVHQARQMPLLSVRQSRQKMITDLQLSKDIGEEANY